MRDHGMNSIPTAMRILIRVVLICPYPLVREGLRLLIHRSNDLSVVGDATCEKEALNAAIRLAPDVIIVDADFPTAEAAAMLRDVRHDVSHSRILILTAHREHDQLLTWMHLGAHGCVTKDVGSPEFIAAIRIVANGETYTRSLSMRSVVERAGTSNARSRFDSLSEREQLVLRSLAEGYSGVEISRSLGISGKTVDVYKRRIEDKLGLSHRTEYVRFGIEAGILGA